MFESSQSRVVIACVRKGSCVLLLKRRRTEGNLLWAFPGGKVESGESDSAAALREVLEETGITCSARALLGERRHPDTQRTVCYVLCEYLRGELLNAEPKSALEVRWVEAADVKTLITSDLYPPLAAILQEISRKPRGQSRASS